MKENFGKINFFEILNFTKSPEKFNILLIIININTIFVI